MNQNNPPKNINKNNIMDEDNLFENIILKDRINLDLKSNSLNIQHTNNERNNSTPELSSELNEKQSNVQISSIDQMKTWVNNNESISPSLQTFKFSTDFNNINEKNDLALQLITESKEAKENLILAQDKFNSPQIDKFEETKQLSPSLIIPNEDHTPNDKISAITSILSNKDDKNENKNSYLQPRSAKELFSSSIQNAEQCSSTSSEDEKEKHRESDSQESYSSFSSDTSESQDENEHNSNKSRSIEFNERLSNEVKDINQRDSKMETNDNFDANWSIYQNQRFKTSDQRKNDSSNQKHQNTKNIPSYKQKSSQIDARSRLKSLLFGSKESKQTIKQSLPANVTKGTGREDFPLEIVDSDDNEEAQPQSFSKNNQPKSSSNKVSSPHKNESDYSESSEWSSEQENNEGSSSYLFGNKDASYQNQQNEQSIDTDKLSAENSNKKN